MAMSENSINVINYLKGKAGVKVTSADVADALGIAKKTVDGAFTSIAKKGLGVRVDGTIPATKDVPCYAINDAGKSFDGELNDNQKTILAYLAGQSAPQTVAEIAAATGLADKSINGTMLHLVKGTSKYPALCDKSAITVETTADIKYLALTDAGMAFTGEEVDA